MTAYELRLHLAAQHGVRLSGADYDALLSVHDVEHRSGNADHEHPDGPGQ
jgi:hypothetical protein